MTPIPGNMFFTGDDTDGNVERLCHKAANPVRMDLLDGLGMSEAGITCGAVCVYPAKVPAAVRTIKRLGIHLPVAAGR